MKCPKCGYLGFETSDRCRNCGYDFSLAVAPEPSPDLPLRTRETPAAPLADLELGGHDDASEPSGSLDLDRLIGAGSEDPPPAVPSRAGPAAPETPAAREPVSGAGPPRPPRRTPAPSADAGLPLFSPESDADDTPLITTPRPVRPPLAVRRATPDVPRGRSRGARPSGRRGDDDPALQLDGQPPPAEPTDRPARESRPAGQPASPAARLLAMLIDVVLLGAVDAAVLYFTLAIAGLTLDELSVLPPIPLAAFLLLLNGGYLIAFTAVSGQTIGKMVAGLRVMGDDGQRVDVAGAVLRAGGCGLTLLTGGLGYLPAFFGADGRALQDRLAGTRVVSA